MPEPTEPSDLLRSACAAARLAIEVTGTPEFRRWILAHAEAEKISRTEVCRMMGLGRGRTYRAPYQGVTADEATPDFRGWDPPA